MTEPTQTYNTNSHSNQDFEQWLEDKGITITGTPPRPLWEQTADDILEEHAPLWRRLARLPDRFIPWQYWALLLAMTMVAIVGLLT